MPPFHVNTSALGTRVTHRDVDPIEILIIGDSRAAAYTEIASARYPHLRFGRSPSSFADATVSALFNAAIAECCIQLPRYLIFFGLIPETCEFYRGSYVFNPEFKTTTIVKSIKLKVEELLSVYDSCYTRYPSIIFTIPDLLFSCDAIKSTSSSARRVYSTMMSGLEQDLNNLRLPNVSFGRLSSIVPPMFRPGSFDIPLKPKSFKRIYLSFLVPRRDGALPLLFAHAMANKFGWRNTGFAAPDPSWFVRDTSITSNNEDKRAKPPPTNRPCPRGLISLEKIPVKTQTGGSHGSHLGAWPSPDTTAKPTPSDRLIASLRHPKSSSSSSSSSLHSSSSMSIINKEWPSSREEPIPLQNWYQATEPHRYPIKDAIFHNAPESIKECAAIYERQRFNVANADNIPIRKFYHRIDDVPTSSKHGISYAGAIDVLKEIKLLHPELDFNEV